MADGRKFSYFKLTAMNSFDLIRVKEIQKTNFLLKWIKETINIHES